MRQLGSITDSVDMNLSKCWEIVEDRGVWCAVVQIEIHWETHKQRHCESQTETHTQRHTH